MKLAQMYITCANSNVDVMHVIYDSSHDGSHNYAAGRNVCSAKSVTTAKALYSLAPRSDANPVTNTCLPDFNFKIAIKSNLSCRLSRLVRPHSTAQNIRQRSHRISEEARGEYLGITRGPHRPVQRIVRYTAAAP